MSSQFSNAARRLQVMAPTAYLKCDTLLGFRVLTAPSKYCCASPWATVAASGNSVADRVAAVADRVAAVAGGAGVAVAVTPRCRTCVVKSRCDLFFPPPPPPFPVLVLPLWYKRRGDACVGGGGGVRVE
eukprot:CAMPEP_0179420678 /NCGR_PEP_ID=MMETSP0799-20121207/9308_1 /TAXON_ID=46947 /ORGANISM="Geminigera cryophila, Strain CCMP2564" /LENGTH=128 /DNA_ID=CAMNT_0021194329 /DNA_START=2083 /DNA_END=2469 /DNA_ORIENTATION=-